MQVLNVRGQVHTHVLFLRNSANAVSSVRQTCDLSQLYTEFEILCAMHALLYSFKNPECFERCSCTKLITLVIPPKLSTVVNLLFSYKCLQVFWCRGCTTAVPIRVSVGLMAVLTQAFCSSALQYLQPKSGVVCRNSHYSFSAF